MILRSLGSVSERASSVLARAAFVIGLTAAIAISPASALDKIEPVSIAVVDAQLITRQSDAANTIRAQIEDRRKIFEQEFQQRETELRQTAEALPQQRAILAQDVFQARLREHQENVAALQRDVQTGKRQLDQAFGRAMGEVRKTMIDIVRELAEEAEIELVLPKDQIFLGHRRVDITQEVMTRLNERLPRVDVTFTEAQN